MTRWLRLVVPALAWFGALALVAGCGGRAGDGVTLRFWAMGREGEVVQELMRDFERENPGVRVQVQQIPWSAAHEKLLTAFVGNSTPDVAQLGNTWIAEFTALNALQPLGAHPTAIDSTAYFPGIWETNVIDGVTYGIPWYVDTRLLFYRRDLLERAGYASMPESWAEWRTALEAIKRVVGDDAYPVFLPSNEFAPLVALGLQAGSPLVGEHGTRGAFSQPEFRAAFDFYLGLFRDGLAPPISNNEIANMYQEFARGYITMMITGPWNLGEFKNRIPPEMQDAWATAPLPGPTGAATGVSLAGGSSLVVFRRTRHAGAAWKLVEFLSRPEQQVRFYALTGDLPARREAWSDSAFAVDPRIRAFEQQLQRVVSTPRIPEWELIANRLQESAERVVRGGATPDSAMASLDREVDRLLEKRRWMLEREARAAGPRSTDAGVAR
jgi:multiple sugar transport system substrate-binding protein